MTDILLNTLQNIFKLSDFRDPQRMICQMVLDKNDILFVAPTGKGKSLCYQLPGVLLGTTLVVSPLIALMDDQFSKINKLGLRAERIHSGMKDSEIAQSVSAYINNELAFVFIAPERLGTDFADILRAHPPSLIAIDEAHTISEFGLNFRPDYRLLKDRLPPGVPIVALTATATPKVQMDVLEQLGRPNAKLVVHGYRRTNISITIQDVRQNAREQAVVNYLKNSAAKPAIVYSGTRKQTEAVAALLKKNGHKCEGYHAGMTPKVRQDVQERFMAGELDVIVATIAFGMGIDKSNIRTVLHLSMPGSIEAYYQEIGRAGRDGLPSKAVMFAGYEDKAKQMWFMDKNYPPVEQLQQVFDALEKDPLPLEVISLKVRLDDELTGQILGKLTTFGSAIKASGSYVKGTKPFRGPYIETRKYNVEKLESMYAFTQDKGCRMLGFLNYFGDTNDDYAACGTCDNCLKSAQKTPEALKAKAAQPVKSEGFAKGSYVSHKKYGIGKVEDTTVSGSLGDRQTTVRFADGTRRVIVERYLTAVTPT